MTQIYHFRLPPAPVTAAIKADSLEDAVKRLQGMLPEKWDTEDLDIESPEGMDDRNEYLTAWFDQIDVTAEMCDDQDYRPVEPLMEQCPGSHAPTAAPVFLETAEGELRPNRAECAECGQPIVVIVGAGAMKMLAIHAREAVAAQP